MNPKRVVGIDLGTTNTALGFAEVPQDPEAPLRPEIFALTQVVRPQDVQARNSLPSFLYLAREGELPEGAMDLPWASGRTFMVGEAARERGAEVPLNLVSSSKSWLSHGGVDRRAPLLPHGAPPEVEKISPVQAAVRYLEHVRDAYDAAHEDKLSSQQVFLTVPASFDAVAKDLTLEAATQAGLTDVILLEEPQAAFYSWLGHVGDGWRDALAVGDRVLVCDVGGGTSDFSLIEVKDDGEGNLTLERVAVGEHVLLGGDNMDLALAHVLHQKLAAEKKKLDAGQVRALVSQARRAKEKLLADADLSEAPITLLGRGSKLIGGKIKTVLTRPELEATLVEGFFPSCGREDRPQEARRTGFMEIGLPFAADAAITRHLAKFLGEHAGGHLPTHVLFNGGVFNSPLLRQRLLDVLSAWGEPPKVLEGTDNDLAVARGAAFFGATRARGGIRIRGGVARSYYVGIESAMPAVPGVPPPMRALCVVPIGMEEGTDAQVPGGTLGLVVGEPVQFKFLTSTTRSEDQIGHVLDEYTWPDHLTETAPITATLEAEGLEPGTLVPVRLEVKLTEIGTLEVWSVEAEGDRRWRLEFNVREEERA